MQTKFLATIPAAILGALLGVSNNVNAAAFVQCPNDANNDAVPEVPGNFTCMHLSGGDGFIKMADGRVLYNFGFSNLTGIPEANAIGAGILAAASPAPTIELDEGKDFYLTLTNVGMIMRPDLFDPHSVHFHGFANASSIFDGVPDGSISINPGASLTYYYNIARPGTYMYHCHVEAAEHMQMGMLGNLYVHPAQDVSGFGGNPATVARRAGNTDPAAPLGYTYNDGDGSSAFDVEYPLQIGSFDHVFHEKHIAVQPLPFAEMKDTYPILNGRGYPDTVDPNPLVPPAENGGIPSQVVSALITASAGQKILLRISNLNVTRFYTLATTGLTMKVIGTGAELLRGPDGKNLFYNTNSVTLGGGEAKDVIIDTTGIAPGTYFLYTSNLNYLSNNDEDFGGMMTEIRIN
ncbi:MAG: multicopper oxidase domain-containing protein [Gammaproteobacteria bacterium]|nr:multicopper oxidase domain-containing protein [Gammaproteobacteria bacterium]